MKKRSLAFSLAWMLMLALIPIFPSAAFAKTYSKTCTIGEKYNLEAENPGNVKGYAWYSNNSRVVRVVYGETYRTCQIEVVGYSSQPVIVRCDIYLYSGKTEYTDYNITIRENGGSNPSGEYKITSYTSSLTVDLASNSSAVIKAGVNFSSDVYLTYENIQGNAGFNISYDDYNRNVAYLNIYPDSMSSGSGKIKLIKENSSTSVSIKDTKTIYYSVTCSHYYNSGVVTTEPTYISEGVKTYTCRYCDHTKTEKIPKLTPPSEYTVAYDANGGSGAPASQKKTPGTALALSSVKPTHTSSAAVSYTVTLNANGGSVSASTLTAARTTNYSFKNWNTKSNGSGESYAPGASYTKDADITLFAQWNNSTATAPVTLPTPTKSGYTFKGWAEDSDASSGVTGSYTPERNVTLFAIWSGTQIGGKWGDLNWSLDAKGTLTISGSGTMKDFDDFSSEAWHECKNSIKQAVIESGITNVGSNAFECCRSMTSVTIPVTVSSIDYSAFYDCGGLTDVYFGGSFSQWQEIPKDYLNTALDNAAVHCAGTPSENEWGTLKWTLSQDGVLTISGNGDIDDFDFLPTEAWHEVKDDITQVIIQPGVTRIGAFAFKDCNSLTAVEIPSSVTSIGEYAFDWCTSLASASLPSGTTSIGDFAFEYNKSLTAVTIPASVRSIGTGAFIHCKNLTSIQVATGNQAYSSLDGVLFNKKRTEIMCCPGGRTGNYAIPAGVKTVTDYAFSGCEMLTGVTIPSSVTSIGDMAFSSCYALTSIKIPSGVTYIGVFAFCGCESLKTITIPAEITTIRDWTFAYCFDLTDVYFNGSEEQWNAIEISKVFNYPMLNAARHYAVLAPDLVLPASLTVIESQAFANGTFKTVYIPPTAIKIAPDAFGSRQDLTIIGVPGSYAEDYAKARGFGFVSAP